MYPKIPERKKKKNPDNTTPSADRLPSRSNAIMPENDKSHGKNTKRGNEGPKAKNQGVKQKGA